VKEIQREENKLYTRTKNDLLILIFFFRCDIAMNRILTPMLFVVSEKSIDGPYYCRVVAG